MSTGESASRQVAQMPGLPSATQRVDELRRRIAEQPGDSMLRVALAKALCETDDVQGAHDTLLEACQLAPNSALAWQRLGELYRDGAHTEQALYALDRAHQLAPDRSEPLHVRASVLVASGRTLEAAESLREALALDPQEMQLWYALANLKTVFMTDAEITQLQALLSAPQSLPDEQRMLGSFALARALENTQRPEQAFALYVEANALKRRQVQWDATAFGKQVDACLAAFQNIAAGDDAGLGGEVIFVVSMPRSGSTLVEQILASHSEVEGAGELSDLSEVIQQESRRRGAEFPYWAAAATAEDWQRLGHLYLERTHKWRTTRPRCVDKSLTNWRLIGAVRAMLPGARIVEARRDALETCWSCFTQLFRRASHFAYDLGEIATFRQDYERLMDFWQQRHPGSIYPLQHEALLAEPEAQIRKLLDFCGLAWQPACLRFHETERHVRTESAPQVREPLRSSTARTDRFGTLLAPLRRALSERPDAS